MRQGVLATMTPIPEKVLASIEQVRLPSMPQVLNRLMHAVEDEHASHGQLAEIVSRDAALAARIIGMANSAAYAGQREGAKSLEACLQRLGLDLVRTLAINLAVQQVFDRLNGDIRCDLADFWAHSLLTAEIARRLAQESAYDNPDEAYLGGLLHDVGEILLLAGMPDGYAMLLKVSPDEEALVENELRLLGTTHADVGAWLVDQWRLESFLGDSLLFHHHDAAQIDDAHTLVRIVWAAHVLAQAVPDDGEARTAGIVRIAGIGIGALAAIREQAARRVIDVASALDIPVDAADGGEAGMLPRRVLPRLPVQTGLPAGEPPPQMGAAEAALADSVRELALLQPLQKALFSLNSDEEVLHVLWESARVLVGLPKLCFFLADQERGVLTGRDIGLHSVLMRQIEVPLDPVRSLLAACAAAGNPLSTFDADRLPVRPVVDKQILRVLGCEGLLCIPMHAAGRLVGVMVFGLSAAQHARIRKRLPWLGNYARLAAAALAARRSARDDQRRIASELADRYRLQARRVAHEAGNPLGIIKNYLGLLSRKLTSGNPLQEELTVLNDEVDRVTRIVRLLHEPPAADAEGMCDVNGIVREMIRLYGEPLFGRRGIVVEMALQEGLAPLQADSDGLKQVLLNLWKNAAEAMRRGGRLRLATADGTGIGGRPLVEIRVADSGPGLPPAVMERLFQPVPAARRDGHEGLGLAIVQAIMQRMGGEASCRSSAAEGTVFRLLLPREAASAVQVVKNNKEEGNG